MTDTERLVAIVRALTQRRNAPGPADDDTAFLLRLLAEHDAAIAQIIEAEAMATIEGEK